MNNTIKSTVRRAGLSALLAAGIVFGAARAHANHTNYIHADMCNSSDAGAFYDDVGAGTPTVTGGTTAFFCPVLNSDPGTMTNATGRVIGFDGDTAGYIYNCFGVMRNSNSDMQMFTGDSQGPLNYRGPISLPTAGNGTITFPSVTFNDSLVIRCDIPPKSAIYNIRIDTGN